MERKARTLNLITDITERKEAENNLRLSELKFRAVRKFDHRHLSDSRHKIYLYQSGLETRPAIPRTTLPA
jgi:hypothetical protein